MIFALLPVKAPHLAKQRLSAVLEPVQREALARSMYEEMMTKVRAARGIDRIIVATSDDAIAAHARRSGALVLEETEQHSHSRSADNAARWAMEQGATTVILLPIDVPLATPAEIESLARAVRPGVLLVPSADGTGTNALVLTPPDAIASHFGPGSFRRHLEEAQARGLLVEVLRPPGLVFDVDTPEDLAELRRAQCPSGS
ncbi:MAG: 2-phospho-L-lactate guanylyltransferase [Acidobacteria bacterium]|nr:2-phospho-L-lactate guanylyltransferase [Acidobacteriota bacterium]